MRCVPVRWTSHRLDRQRFDSGDVLYGNFSHHRVPVQGLHRQTVGLHFHIVVVGDVHDILQGNTVRITEHTMHQPTVRISPRGRASTTEITTISPSIHPSHPSFPSSHTLSTYRDVYLDTILSDVNKRRLDGYWREKDRARKQEEEQQGADQETATDGHSNIQLPDGEWQRTSKVHMSPVIQTLPAHVMTQNPLRGRGVADVNTYRLTLLYDTPPHIQVEFYMNELNIHRCLGRIVSCRVRCSRGVLHKTKTRD